MNKRKIAVIFGGISTEHEVSVITGIQVLENIDKEQYSTFPIYVSKEGKLFTGDALRNIETYKELSNIPNLTNQIQPIINGTQSGFELTRKSFGRIKRELIIIDTILSCFHGGLGEKGGFPGLFEDMNIPYSGPGITASGVAMDKVMMKNLFTSVQIPQTAYLYFERNNWKKNKTSILDEISSKLSYPLYIKPANGGSTIGVTKANDKKELENALEVAFVFDRKVIAEENFSGREINIAVLGNSGDKLQFSVLEEVLPTKEFLSYDDKYKSNSKTNGMASAKREIPAKIKSTTAKKIEELARKVFETLDLSGVSRIDFMISKDESKIVVLEANSIPGSLSFYLWEPKGIKFKQLLTNLIDLAIEKHADEGGNIKSFSSNILQNFKPGNKNSKI